MRKIFFLLPYYPKWIDGGLKYQTMVFNYFKTKYEFVYSFGKSVDVIHSKYKVIRIISKSIHLLRIIIAIFHIIKIPKSSIIILNNAFFFDYSLPITINRFWKKHIYIIIVHHLVQKDRPAYLRTKFENHFIKKANKLITISKTTQNELADLSFSPDEIPILYPGLDVAREKVSSEKYFPIKPRLLYVGSIEKKKGLEYLIKALGRLKSFDFELLLIGRLDYYDFVDYLKKIIDELGLNNRVKFSGWVSKEELIISYLESTIFVFPSLWEGYGAVVAEAMGYGLPVIASKIPAMEELLENGSEGILFEVKNVDEIYNALKLLLNKKDLLVTYSKNALIKANTFPSWEQTSDDIWQIISKEYLNS